MATVLADISNLNIGSEEVLSKTILEKILGMYKMDGSILRVLVMFYSVMHLLFTVY